MLDQNSPLSKQSGGTDHLPVLSFLIKGFKNERDGTVIAIGSSDDAYAHNAPAGVSESIAKVLKANQLEATDIISITATTGYGKVPGQDIGSWDFWLFCRNPRAVLVLQRHVDAAVREVSQTYVMPSGQHQATAVVPGPADVSGLSG